MDGSPQKRSDDKIPSAYKLWMQTALNNMQTPPQMLEDIKKAVSEANEMLLHKINNNIQKQVADVTLEHERFKGEVEAKLAGIEATAKTLKLVFAVAATILGGSFALVTIFV